MERASSTARFSTPDRDWLTEALQKHRGERSAALKREAAANKWSFILAEAPNEGTEGTRVLPVDPLSRGAVCCIQRVGGSNQT
jgi:hypothetical protein